MTDCGLNEKKKSSGQCVARQRLPSSRIDSIRRVMGDMDEQEAKEIGKSLED